MSNNTSTTNKIATKGNKVEIVEEIYNYSVVGKKDADYYNAKEVKVKKIVRKLL